ncbi:hypothetical protein KA013_00470 [Patescibacteria group bacterium]|nr:hypothetical protein [Patescibacteria group bacterium]
MAQCIVRKRVENQTRYFANNALHMHIDIMFPDISELGKNIDKLKDVSDL